MSLSARQCVEMFHLVLLRALTAKGQGKAQLTLKGGCNLRFFFGSVRYSEDIDFDITVVAVGTLRNKVDRLLRSPLVNAPLETRGIEIVGASAPKQTATTQRWKVGLRAHHLAVPLHTKVEFSRRKATGHSTFEAVGRDVLRPYGLTQVLCTHYTTSTAIDQKIQALWGRAEPQARDMFDLQLLFAHAAARGERVTRNFDASRLEAAVDRAMSISYDEYRSQVVAYLDPEQAAVYQDRSAWDAMQSDVVAQLEALR